MEPDCHVTVRVTTEVAASRLAASMTAKPRVWPGPAESADTWAAVRLSDQLSTAVSTAVTTASVLADAMMTAGALV